MTGIIGALDAEMEAITERIENRTQRTISNVTYYAGNIGDKEVVAAECGVGKINAAVCAQIMISVFGADKIINTGIGGGLNTALHQYDMVVAERFYQHDCLPFMNEHPDGWIYGLEREYVEADAALSEAFFGLCDELYPGLAKRGSFATGDQFVSDTAAAAEIRRKFGADVCDMESGAIAQVCALAGVPFASVRCISDSADDSPVNTYMEFRNKCAARSSALAIEAARRF